MTPQPNLRPSVTWQELSSALGLRMQPSVHVQAAATKIRRAANDSMTLMQLKQTSCSDGERTAHLTRLIGTLLHNGYDWDQCIEECHQWNAINKPPLDDEKVESTFYSILATDQRNNPERYQALSLAPLFDLAAGRIDKYLRTEPDPRKWLLKDFIPLGKVGAVIAPGGSSKSQFLLQLGVSVATGVPLANHWAVGEAGGVLMLCAEDDEEEIHRRIHKVCMQLVSTGNAASLEQAKERLYIFSTIGHDTLMTKRSTTGEVSSTEIVERIVLLAKGIPALRLIVIDPASRFRGGDENKNEDGTRFVQALEKLAELTGATILIAHHSNKSSYNADGGVDQGASRGASSLTDGIRWQLNLGPVSTAQIKAQGLTKDTAHGYVCATVTKSNYSAKGAPVILVRSDGGYLTAIKSRTCDELSAEREVRVLKQLSEIKAVTARVLEDKYGGIDGALKMSKQTLRTTLLNATSKGYISGGSRAKLVITEAGLKMLKSGSIAPGATVWIKSPPHAKSQ
jgi:RecA-family ATPase